MAWFGLKHLVRPAASASLPRRAAFFIFAFAKRAEAALWVQEERSLKLSSLLLRSSRLQIYSGSLQATRPESTRYARAQFGLRFF